MDGSVDREQAGEQRNSERKTQRERREATVGKLVDATIAAIFEIGYARTSIQEICQRAGVSHGGLFRHFDTRLALIVAAAEEASQRLVSGFRAQLAGLSESGEVLIGALGVLRDSVASPLSSVWHEVLIASRTDDVLRERLRPAADAFYAQIQQTAAALPRVGDLSEQGQEIVVLAVLNLYAGANVLRQLLPETTFDDRLAGLGLHLLGAAEAVDVSTDGISDDPADDTD